MGDISMSEGVPIARPPLGKRRFKLPEPPDIWEGVRNATLYSAACISNSTVSSSVQKHISEDCLYMNVFVCERCLTKTHSCPVVFYVHGGSLNYDSAVMFDDKYITDRYSSNGTVFVISAFRLGFFGVSAFTDQSVAPRNLALYDIIAGLEMVHSEVGAFGGDPGRVTLMGHSQGASIAVVFAVSRLIDPERRLFQQVIALSPTINYRVTSSRLDLTWRFAHEIGCAVNRTRPVESAHSEIEDVVDCLRRIDTSDLLAMQRLIEERDGLMFDGILYGPPFVDEDTPHSVFVLGSSNRRMMCGSTKFEFNMDKNDSQYDIGTFLQVAHPELVRRKYLHDKEQGIPDNYLSQVVFSNNVIFGSVFTAKGSDVYLMEFGQKPNPMHASDLPFFIGVHMRNFTEDEKLIDRFYATSIINFIHGRVPSDDWLPFDPAKRNYYSVEADIRKGIYPSNKLNYHYEVVDYWLRNMTSFDKALSDVLRFDLYDVIPSASTARTMASIVLFGLALLLLLFVLMAACSTLSASDPPNHEQVPLVHHKPSQITRKDTVVVSALKAR